MESFEGAIVLYGAAPSSSAAPPGINGGTSTVGDVRIDGYPRSIIPFTLKSISSLQPSSEIGPTFHFHGMPVSTVRVLGRMVNRRDMEGVSWFVLDDGTCRIDARVTLVGFECPQDMEKAKDGDYVVVDGGLLYTGGVKFVDVYSFRCVTNFNDITHHFLYSIYAHLDLKKLAKERRDARQEASDGIQSAPEVTSPPLMNNGGDLFDNVLRVFVQPGLRDLENGATFALIQQKTGAREDELRSVIEAHISIGNMFTTIDEDHFKSSMNG